MALDITTRHREYDTRAMLDAQTQFLRDLPRRRIGFDAERSSADLTLLNTPAYEGGEDGSVDMGWNGETVRFFTGVIQSPSAASPSIDRTVQLVDKLGLLIQKSFTSNITWSSRSFENAVRDVLTGVGVASSDIAYIYDPGITLGGTYSITISTSESPAEVFRQLMDYGGTKAVVYPNGKIYVLNVSGIPTASYAQLSDGTPMLYAFGATSTELPLIEASWILETIENPIVNITITGPTRSDGVTPTANSVLSATGRPWSQQYRFVQDSTTADTIADRELSRRAVPRRVVQFRADSNPYLMPGMTVGFRDETIGLSSTSAAFVWSVAIDGPTMTVVAWMGLHVIDGPTTLLPPTAVPVIVSIEKQPVIVGGSTVVRYFVQLDGTASTDPDGYIVTYAWTATGATPSSSSDIKPMFVYATLDGSQQITLVVTDNHGQTNSVTVTLPASTDSSIVRRQLLIAEGTSGLAFVNDGATFQSFTRVGRSCTAVPTINQLGSLLSGWDDGAIYKINDELTAIEAMATLAGGQINALWVNEADGNNILVGAGSSFYRSTDGATFTLRKALTATINDCQNSPVNSDEVRVASGQYLKLSFDGGLTFSDVITGAAGTTARMIATAPWGHACVFIGGASSADAIKFEEGYTVDWSAVASPPTALRTITALLDTQGFVVGDGAGKLYKLLWDGSGFDATDITTISGTPSVDDGIRDGLLRGLQYYATTAGTRKLVNLATVWDVRNTAAIQIGYGVIGAYVAPGAVEVLVPIVGVAGGGVWHYVPGTGWARKNSGLPAGTTYGRWIAANPFNANHWLLLLNTTDSEIFHRVSNTVLCDDNATNPLWLTTDNGATWSAVTLTLNAADVDFANLDIYNIEWSPTTSGQWFSCARKRQVGGTNTAIVWRGSGTASTLTSLTATGTVVAPLWCAAGLSDTIIFSNTGQRAGYLLSGATTVGALATGLPHASTYLERAAGLYPQLYGTERTSGVAAVADRLFYLQDHRSGNTQTVILTNGKVSFVTATADGSVFLGGDTHHSLLRQDVLKLTNFLTLAGGTTATETIMASTAVTGSEVITQVRAGRQKRIALAARIMHTSGGASGKDMFVSKDQGATWTRVPGPASAGNTDLSRFIEVLER